MLVLGTEPVKRSPRLWQSLNRAAVRPESGSNLRAWSASRTTSGTIEAVRSARVSQLSSNRSPISPWEGSAPNLAGVLRQRTLAEIGLYEMRKHL